VAAPRVVEDNGLLAFTEFVLPPVAALRGRQFMVDRSRDGLEPLVYSSIEQMHKDYKMDLLVCSCTLKMMNANTFLDSSAPERRSHISTQSNSCSDSIKIPELERVAGSDPEGLPTP
jgi:hypothetical protein